MATKEYSYQHALPRDVVRGRVEGALEQIARQYGLEREDLGEDRFRLHRSGVDVQVAVDDGKVTIKVDLSWVLEKAVRKVLEDKLDREVRPILV